MTTSGPSDLAAFRRALRRSAPSITRPLPWIGDVAPWAILVSEVMLQQTSTSRVIGPWTRFLERFPTPRACADAPLAEVLTCWRGLGYHRRAKALHDAARIVCDEFDGLVPREVSELRRLPGVGEYTANAVASFAYGAPVAVLDTNVGRVLARALANRPLRPREARALASSLLPRTDVAAFNQAMLDLGAQFCRATPRCETCPVSQRCSWRRDGGPDPAPRSAGVSTAQSRFEGSSRQLRGRIIEALRDGPRTALELETTCSSVTREQRDEVVAGLERDGLVTRRDSWFALVGSLPRKAAASSSRSRHEFGR